MPKGFTNLIWPTLSNKVSLSVSSLPGPTFDFEFCGSPIENVSFFVPPQGTISLFVTIMTWQGRVSVSMTSDKVTADETQLTELVQLFTSEIDGFVAQGKKLSTSGAIGDGRLDALNQADRSVQSKL